MRRRRTNPEAIIQRAVMQHIDARGVPGLVAFAVPNGGIRSPIEAAILKGQGVKAGVSDIILLHDSRFYAIELKPEGRTPTESQLAFIDRVNAAGGFACWTVGLDRALKTLETWGLLRGVVS